MNKSPTGDLPDWQNWRGYQNPYQPGGVWIDAHFVPHTAHISQSDIERIARRVVELLKEKPE